MNLYTRVMLFVIAVSLITIALRPVFDPAPVRAQPDGSQLYVEPGTTALRKPDGSMQVEGKVIIDLRNGDIWGFPTLSGTPYPVNSTDTKPPVSEPMYLGRFDLSKMRGK